MIFEIDSSIQIAFLPGIDVLITWPNCRHLTSAPLRCSPFMSRGISVALPISSYRLIPIPYELEVNTLEIGE